MKKFAFTIIATGLDPNADHVMDRFFEAGCDDATIAFQKGVILLDFDREAKSFARAITSAIRNVQAAGARVRHVEPDHLVSLSDIAARAGLTRAAVSHYANGERGKEFPAPVARVTTESPLWSWVDVARWFFRQRRISRAEVVKARVVQRVNATIARTDRDRLAA